MEIFGTTSFIKDLQFFFLRKSSYLSEALNFCLSSSTIEKKREKDVTQCERYEKNCEKR